MIAMARGYTRKTWTPDQVAYLRSPEAAILIANRDYVTLADEVKHSIRGLKRKLDRLGFDRSIPITNPFRLAGMRRKAPCPPEPTMFLPGSREKMEVIRQRIVAGYQCFHPGDATG